MEEKVTIADVTKGFMGREGLTQEQFSDALNESLVNTGIGRVAVTHWCNSKNSPKTDLLLVIFVVYKDWRMRWALECLKVKLPEVFDSGLVTFHLPKPAKSV